MFWLCRLMLEFSDMLVKKKATLFFGCSCILRRGREGAPAWACSSALFFFFSSTYLLGKEVSFVGNHGIFLVFSGNSKSMIPRVFRILLYFSNMKKKWGSLAFVFLLLSFFPLFLSFLFPFLLSLSFCPKYTVYPDWDHHIT